MYIYKIRMKKHSLRIIYYEKWDPFEIPSTVFNASKDGKWMSGAGEMEMVENR